MQTLEQTKQERKTVTIELDVKKFMPNLLWVLKAKSTDENRYVLNYLNIDDNGFCCTDGRRLHLCGDVTGLPKGLEHGIYQVNICKNVIMFIPKEGDFPKYIDVIPKYETKGIEIDLTINKHDDKNKKLSTAFTKIVRMMTKNSINLGFLKDLEGYTWSVQQSDDRAFKFVSGINTAIFMPLRTE